MQHISGFVRLLQFGRRISFLKFLSRTPPLFFVLLIFLKLLTKQRPHVNGDDTPCLTSFHLTGCVSSPPKGLGGHGVASLTMTCCTLRWFHAKMLFFPPVEWLVTHDSQNGEGGVCTLPLRFTHPFFVSPEGKRVCSFMITLFRSGDGQ